MTTILALAARHWAGAERAVQSRPARCPRGSEMNNVMLVTLLSVRLAPGLPIVAAAGQSGVLGHAAEALQGQPLARLCPPTQPDGRESAAALAELFEGLQAGELRRVDWSLQGAEGRVHRLELHLSRLAQDPTLVTVCLLDLGALQLARLLDAGRNELLEMVATGQPLETVLARLTTLIEAQFDGLYCSVLLLDADGRHIRRGVGPRMPADYMQALDGIAIGPGVGSCGTAMHEDRTVIVEDIATDPLWAPYKGLALPHGLRACWSEPIHAAGQGVVGSFAMYYREVRRPCAAELHALQTASHLAGIALDQARRDAERRRNAQWLEEQVRERTAALAAAQDELLASRKLAALGRLVAGIAHEMNTPLGNALLAANALQAQSAALQGQLADRQPLKRQALTDWLDQAHSSTALIEQNVDRALRLINRFKQLTEGPGQVRRTRFGPRAAVLQAWALVQTRLDVGRVQLVCHVPETLQLDGYPDVLQQVLEQLLENACLHGFPAGRAGQITVQAQRSADGRRLRMEVGDNGAGMPAADVARAFEPFFTTAFGQGGSGLGLFVAHSLVSGLLGGSLQIDSAPGRGTRVVLELPLEERLALVAA
ncbi:MAG: sensor histidine kinase [Roseateles sp.]|nr:MAG: sensor histidine kinase [Roseateles sp.]